MKKSSEKISSIRQQIYLLQKERNSLIWNLLDSLNSAVFIPASFSFVYKTCGNLNCKCHKGEKHGPYPALQIKINNKSVLKMIKKEKESEIRQKINAYKKYQTGLARINKLNMQINKLLQEARNNRMEKYP